jgi:hypothetical protein
MRALVVEEWQADAGAIPVMGTDTDDREGDIIMLQTEDRPAGDEPATVRRRPPRSWLLVAAAAAVAALVGTLLVVNGGDEDPVDTGPSATTPAPAPAGAQNIQDFETFAPVEPGLYFLDPDGDTTPLRVTYEIAAEGWSPWFGAVKFLSGNADGFTGLSIATVSNVVTDGCSDHTPLAPPVGPTVDDLATALTRLAPFEVTAPPTDVTLFGYEGKHLELTVPDSGIADCLDGELHSWIAPVNDNGPFSGYDGPGQSEEFWILDVEGTRLVLVKFDSPLSAAGEIAERDAIFDSVRIETG